MKKINISKDWIFQCPEQTGSRTLDLPHDYSIELPRNPDALGGASNGFFTGTIGEYVKYLAMDSWEHVFLDVDGAYMCTQVFLNEDLLAMHPYGYTPFLVDLSEGIRRGNINKISLKTQNVQPSTRWYSGAGCYRDVFLWTGGAIRIEPRDIFITTQYADEEVAKVTASIDITADFETDIELLVCLYDADEKVVSKRNLLQVERGKNSEMLTFEIAKPNLWSAESPYLYSLKAEIRYNQQLEDEAELRFGIRTVEANAKDGLRINGKEVKLQGGCVHHDHGGLGAASFPEAERRKLSLLKSAGYNAVRVAHNPPSLAFLEVCDEIGLYVMDEAFDVWRIQKNKLDYSMWFQFCWQDDIRDMVLRDRNHPSVISYSIGNEIPERSGVSRGADWSAILTKEIKKYDTTKLVTAGVCDVWDFPVGDAPETYKENFMCQYWRGTDGAIYTEWDKKTEAYMEPLDIVGYNYLYERYEQDHKNYPERVIWGSETHALNFYHSWNSVMQNSHVIGDFTWTAYDNLGEAGCGRSLWERDGEITGISLAGYPWRTCYQGDFDLCGYRRPQSYFRESMWKKDCEPRIFTTHPEHYGEKHTGTGWHWHDVHETWTFEDKYIGCPVKVEVYTDADEVQFILNGKDMGRVVQKEHVATLDIPYEKGKLTAVSYKQGRAIKEYSLLTTGKACKLKIVPEKQTFIADNRDLCYFDIFATDEKGEHVTESDFEISCEVEGGEMMTVFSGNPANEDEYYSGKCHLFEGKAIAIVRSKNSGKVTLSVQSAELRHAQATVCANEGETCL